MRKTIINVMALILLAMGLSVSGVYPAGAALTVTADHDQMNVDYNYHGSMLDLSGVADKGVDLVITIASEDVHQKLKQKTKVGGVLWMNTGDVSLEHIPNVYYQLCNKDIKDVLSEEAMMNNELGYPALFKRADIEATRKDADKKALFDEFVKYKESSKLYSVSGRSIELSEQGDGQKYSANFKWPFQIPPGEYQVTVNAVKDGKIVERSTTTITVERSGIVKRLTSMAQKNGALYGVLAIVIALGAGFGVGLIFGKGGGAH